MNNLNRLKEIYPESFLELRQKYAQVFPKTGQRTVILDIVDTLIKLESAKVACSIELSSENPTVPTVRSPAIF